MTDMIQDPNFYAHRIEGCEMVLAEYPNGEVMIAMQITHGCCGKMEGFLIRPENARHLAAALLEAANDAQKGKDLQ